MKNTTATVLVKPSFADWQDRAAALRLKRCGSELKGPCPCCGGRDRFSVRKSRDGGALFYCRKCDPGRHNADAYKKILEAAGFAINRSKPGRTLARKPARPRRTIIALNDEPPWYAAQIACLHLHILRGTIRLAHVCPWRHPAVKWDAAP